MFADTALGAAIDRAEARLCAQFALATSPSSAMPEPLILPISGGHAIFVAPASPINKVIGLGFDTPLDLDALTRIEEQWRELGEPVRIELSILTDPEIGGVLSGRGYQLHGFENVLGRGLNGARQDAAAATNVTVETLQAADADAWVDIAVEAFMNLDGSGSVPEDSLSREQMRAALLPYTAIPDVVRYLARLDGRPVGEAAMRVDGTIAQLAGAGTLPAYRGRGVQKALLARRLNDAAEAGCRLAVVVTAPGTRSQENAMRRGFALLYTRAILVKRWDASA